MILQKLYIHDYKLLQDFDIKFTKQISVFIGINGSGKSSILESLALLFSVAYEQTILKKKSVAPDYIKQSYVEYFLRYETETEKEAMHSKFNIDYIPVKLLVNEQGKVEITINVDKEKEKDFYSEISKKYSDESLLPKRLIIYYSGISNHFQSIYQSTEDYLLKQLKLNPSATKQGYVENTQMPMFLFNPSDFNLLFAGLWAFSFNDRISKKLFGSLKISNSTTLITLVINKAEFDKVELKDRLKEIDNDIILIEDNDADADLLEIKRNMISDLNKRRAANFFGASGRLGAFLKQLQETCLTPDNVYDELKEEYTFNFSIGKWQYLSEDVIQNPKMVFELLLMLKYNGLLKELNVNVIKDNTEINGEQLSEGEKQVIIITALNEIVGTNNALFLFDEPDNYLHPSLQDDLIINIEANNDTNEMYQNHYCVTTHNPSFLNNLDSAQGELFIMKVGKLHHHSLSWYGRDVNDTVHEIMGSEFRPKWATKEIQNVDTLLDTGKIDEGEKAFKSLKSKLSGTDIEIIRLQTKLDFLKD
ncbi:MAG: AAA family ATPase [Flavobacterium sp.]|nr:AAA family ATPase [Flavobacterium sp.]